VIDLHVHVLPGIDDGPADMPGSVALARAAARDGTTVVAATPHLRADHPAVRPEELGERRRATAEAVSAAGVGLEIFCGAEVDIRWTVGASDEQLRLASFGQRGTDLLVETPYGPLEDDFEAKIDALHGRGIRVLLAHPERNPTFQAEPRRLERLVERGVLLQVTALAVVSRRRRSRSRWLAQGLVEHGMAHVIASDSHGAGGARPPGLSAAVAVARRLAPLHADWMATDAPRAVLEGEPLRPPGGRTRPGQRRSARLAAGRRTPR
jgi:protein-tyrosine phosphatase